MGIIRKLREWRESSDGTLTGPALQTDVLNNGGPISDGDGTERKIYIIENGASDPSDATATDIIIEKEA